MNSIFEFGFKTILRESNKFIKNLWNILSKNSYIINDLKTENLAVKLKNEINSLGVINKIFTLNSTKINF